MQVPETGQALCTPTAPVSMFPHTLAPRDCPSKPAGLQGPCVPAWHPRQKVLDICSGPRGWESGSMSVALGLVLSPSVAKVQHSLCLAVLTCWPGALNCEHTMLYIHAGPAEERGRSGACTCMGASASWRSFASLQGSFSAHP